MRLRGEFALLATLFLLCPPAKAQSFLDSIMPGQQVSQAVYNLLPPNIQAMVRVAGGNQRRNGLNARGLPPTTLDSFVHQAGGAAESIYGDEGVDGPPPISGFESDNRINAGIFGSRDAGLTTGHGSLMPAAWGGDEYCHGTEWVRSGSNGGNMKPIYTTPILDLNGIINATTTGAGIGTERPSVTPEFTLAPTTINYDLNAPQFIKNFGQWATEVVPYPVTPDMKPVQNNETHQLMGWIAPGETPAQFLSGQTGRLLPGQAIAAQAMLSRLGP